jgi:hypothetical protein
MQIAIIFNKPCYLASKFAPFVGKNPETRHFKPARIFALQSTADSLNVIRLFIDKEPCRALRYLR